MRIEGFMIEGNANVGMATELEMSHSLTELTKTRYLDHSGKNKV